jgi:hypothetical protein
MGLEQLTSVKWIGPNEPMIRINRNDTRLYLTKRELVSLMNEINGFTAYYNKDFTEDRIDIETPLEEYITNRVNKND